MSVKLGCNCPELSAKMPKRKKASQERQKTLDAFSRKRGRGRPWKVRPSEVVGRARNYRGIFAQVWSRLRAPLLAANNEDEVIQAFQDHAQPYVREFVPRLAADILRVIHDPKFPKRPNPQIGFLADSLAGRPNVELRTSRDICGEARGKERAKSPHKIVRKEFYIECSCGYKGPARDNACRRCGAEIPLSFAELLTPRVF
jgi:hypothetical protein